ncbi:phosphoribosylpyrophosphate synthetase [Flavobacterium sp. ANB]|uniref:phosphoribosylpyrophosphate synthetase n=1 Tax=unclassified Flavobacterium TaxID=196869 RepID=UPI0012B78C98|nr:MULTISPECIES: phosphoribosylpyrophosphate synthetase [unclassified Flavobacterium]MBF4515541.1 phosphoribosylpyrophosphate synthetase [Flavobacterium sp. ANB]MTD68544.1 phosphoribosylpyrophosphate synthetase [Flavobacterium sp. LC2016-13]
MENPNQQPSFDTVTEALLWLSNQGFTKDFNIAEDCIVFNNGKQSLSPDEFNIEYYFRFEGDTDPGDEDIVYGISSVKNDIKGVLMSAFGMYADSISVEMIKKLAVH